MKELTAATLFEKLREWGDLRKKTRLYFRGEKAFGGKVDFPLQIAGVRRAEDPITSVVRGCLIAAALAEN